MNFSIQKADCNCKICKIPPGLATKQLYLPHKVRMHSRVKHADHFLTHLRLAADRNSQFKVC
jgi:hypothetical protein